MTRSTLIRTGLLLGSLALLAFIAGPVEAVEESSWGAIKQAVDDNGVAAKKGGKGKGNKSVKVHNGSTEAENDIGAAGGKLTVQVDGDMDVTIGDLKVTLEVPKNALPKGETIQMSVYGVHPDYPDGDQILPEKKIRASNLVIDFGPDGLEFRKSCRLKIRLGAELNDLKEGELEPWHQHGNGQVNQAGIISYYVTDTGGVAADISVDGFSRYGLKRY